MDHRIRGEVARAELEELGAKHYLDVRATIRRMLENLPAGSRAAFAAAVTERVLRQGTPSSDPSQVREVDALIASARPLLDMVWKGLCGSPDADESVAQSLAQFYQSRYLCTHRHDDPASMADHVAMTALYTAECYLHGCWEFAAWTGWRGFDAAAIRAAADDAWLHRRLISITSYAWELAHPVVQGELERQLEDVELLTSPDLTGPDLTGTDLTSTDIESAMGEPPTAGPPATELPISEPPTAVPPTAAARVLSPDLVERLRA